MRNEVHSRQEGMYDQPPFFLNPFIYILQFLFLWTNTGFPQHFQTQNREESRRFKEKFCRIRGQFRKKSRRIEIFLTFSNKIKENRGDFSKSMRNGAFAIEAFNITVFL